jgi:hypothetical protein
MLPIESVELTTWMKACLFRFYIDYRPAPSTYIYAPLPSNERGAGYIDYDYVIAQVKERRKERKLFIERSYCLFKNAAKHGFNGCFRMDHPSSALFLSWNLAKYSEPLLLDKPVDRTIKTSLVDANRIMQENRESKEEAIITISPFVSEDEDEEVESVGDACIVQWMLDKPNGDRAWKVADYIYNQSTNRSTAMNETTSNAATELLRKRKRRKQFVKEMTQWYWFFKHNFRDKRHVTFGGWTSDSLLYKVLMFNKEGREIVPCFKLHNHKAKCYNRYYTSEQHSTTTTATTNGKRLPYDYDLYEEAAEHEFDGRFEDTSTSSRGLLFLSWSMTSNHNVMTNTVKELFHYCDKFGVKRPYRPVLVDCPLPIIGTMDLMKNNQPKSSLFGKYHYKQVVKWIISNRINKIYLLEFIWLNEQHQPKLSDNGTYYLVKAR